MAHFYGTIRGARGEASRLGHKSSGFRADAASWQGRASITLHHDEDTGRDIVTVRLEPHHGAGVDRVLYRGPVGG
jgi:hypothetical protein